MNKMDMIVRLLGLFYIFIFSFIYLLLFNAFIATRETVYVFYIIFVLCLILYGFDKFIRYFSVTQTRKRNNDAGLKAATNLFL